MEALKKLQEEIQALRDELEGSRTDGEKALSELRDELLVERKKTFETEELGLGAIEKLKKRAADMHLKSILLAKPIEDMVEYKEVTELVVKAITPADITSWLAEEFSNRIMEDLELELKVEALFDRIQMPASRNQLSIPARNGNAVAYLIAPAADAVESAIASGKITFETQRIKTLITIADQADQESVTAVLDLVRAELVRSLVRASEDAIVNGDTTFATANNPKKMFDGLRKIANANAADGGGVAATAAKILETRKRLGVYGVNLADLVILANVNVAYGLLGLAEVITVDKYGAAATIHTGELGKIYGMPIIVTEYIADDLETDGADHDTVGVTTEILIVNVRYFAVADRNNITVEQDRNITSSVNLYVAFRDMDFKRLLTSGTPAAALTNII